MSLQRALGTFAVSTARERCSAKVPAPRRRGTRAPLRERAPANVPGTFGAPSGTLAPFEAFTSSTDGAQS